MTSARRMSALAAVALAACQAPNSGLTFEGGAGVDAAGPQGMEGSDSGSMQGSGASNDTVDPPATSGAATSSPPADAGSGEVGTAGGSGGAGFTEIGYQFTTVAYGAEYDPDHIVAVWVEQGGAFVRTLEVHADKRLEHLIAWRLASGEDVTDAVTSATIKDAHGSLSGVWDLHDAAGAPVAAGDYTLKVELTADNSNAGNPAGPVLEVPINVGDAGFDAAPPAAQGFQDIRVWSQ